MITQSLSTGLVSNCDKLWKGRGGKNSMNLGFKKKQSQWFDIDDETLEWIYGNK